MSDVAQYGQVSAIAGPLAFVLTAGHMVLGLRFYYRIFVLAKVPAKKTFVLFIITSIVAYTAWFVHLWPLNNLYVRTALLLEIIGAVILIMHAVYQAKYTQTKNE